MTIDTTDKSLRRAVLAGLVADPRLSTGHLNVTVENGVAALCGYVTSNAQKDAAWLAAQRVHGLTLVTNDIQVALPDPVSDHAGKAGGARSSRLTLPISFGASAEQARA
jgi:hypothetical protein